MKKADFMTKLETINAKNFPKELRDRIAYTLKAYAKDPKSVDVPTLTELNRDINAAEAELLEAVEAMKKPATSGRAKLGKKKPVEAEPEADEDEEEIVEKPAPKKTMKKAAKKEEPVKDEEVTTASPSTNASGFLPGAKTFPKTVHHEDLGELVCCTGEYDTFEKVRNAVHNDENLYLLCYWTKAMLKKFNYAKNYQIPKGSVANGFPHDLDIAVALIACDEVERLYAMSVYTEAMYPFEGADFEYIEDHDPKTGDKFRVRVSCGMEFEIYKSAK